jgi:hypothetical protein
MCWTPMIHFLKDLRLAISGNEFFPRRDLQIKLFHVEQFDLTRAESFTYGIQVQFSTKL